MKKPPLTIDRILAWADAHHKRTGRWPTENSGPVHGARSENWQAIANSLFAGNRGLPGGLSLSRLLWKHRGKLPKSRRSTLTIEQILAWADEHYKRTGKWPTNRSDRIHGTRDETWHGVAACLYTGCRGLRCGLSLSRLLWKYRGKSPKSRRSALTIDQILAWADAHHERSGRWPTLQSGPIYGTRDESWRAIASALRIGSRGLPGGWSLGRLLKKYRNAKFPHADSFLTIQQILKWADKHHKRTGKWPSVHAGRVGAAPDETWFVINDALRRGSRGLPGGQTLFRLLSEHRGVHQ
jgi:hypothetical protein